MKKQKSNNFIDMTGTKVRWLTVVKYLGNGVWDCVCDCGNTRKNKGQDLRSGVVASCGCKRGQITSYNNTKHGHASRAKTTPGYFNWKAMHYRCTKKNHKAWKNYGGRGVTVCKRWNKFENFLADMGVRPNGKTIDRINPNGNYTPSNCRWASVKEQNNNMRSIRHIEHEGKTKTIAQWAEFAGIPRGVMWHRIDFGWDMNRALSEPVRKRTKRK